MVLKGWVGPKVNGLDLVGWIGPKVNGLDLENEFS